MKTFTKNTTKILNTHICIQKFDNSKLLKSFQNYYRKNVSMGIRFFTNYNRINRLQQHNIPRWKIKRTDWLQYIANKNLNKLKKLITNLIKHKVENKINKKPKISRKFLYKILQKLCKIPKYRWIKIISKSGYKGTSKKIKQNFSKIIYHRLFTYKYSWPLAKKKIQKYLKWYKLINKNKYQNSIIIFKNEFWYLIKELQIKKKKKKITSVKKLTFLLEIAAVWLQVRKFFLVEDFKNLKNITKIKSDIWDFVTKKNLYSPKNFLQLQMIHYLVFHRKRKIIQFYQFYSLFAVVGWIHSHLYKYFSYNFIIILGQNWYEISEIAEIFPFNSIIKFQRSRMLFFIKFLRVILNHPTKNLMWDPELQEYKLQEKSWTSLKLAPTTEVQYYRNIYVWYHRRVKKLVKNWFKNRNKPKYAPVREWDIKKKALVSKKKWKLVHKKRREMMTLLKNRRLQRIFYKNRRWRSIRYKKPISLYKYICYVYTNIISRKRSFPKWKVGSFSFRKWKVGTGRAAFLKKYKWPKWPKWKRTKYFIPKFLHVNYIYRKFYLFTQKRNIFNRYFPGIYRIYYHRYNTISNRVLLIRPDELSLNITTILDAFIDFPSKFKKIQPSLEEFTIWLYITYCIDISKKTNIQTNFIINNLHINTPNSLKPKLLNLITKYNSILNSFYPEWSELQLNKTTTEEARLHLIHRVFKIIGFNDIPEKHEIENLNKPPKKAKHEDPKKIKKKGVKIKQFNSILDNSGNDHDDSSKEKNLGYKIEDREDEKLWNTHENWIRKRKLIFKLKILFDLLFLWLYRHKNAVYLFHFIRKRVFKFYPKSYQIIYKKNIKIRFNSTRLIKT